MKGWFRESYRHYLASKGIKTSEQYKRWRYQVNMSPAELRRFVDSQEGKVAGLSRTEASAQGIKSGRDSARAILRMRSKSPDEWTAEERAWMGRQNSFVARMKGASGPLYDEQGRPTRKLLALKIWGHDPEKRGHWHGGSGHPYFAITDIQLGAKRRAPSVDPRYPGWLRLGDWRNVPEEMAAERVSDVIAQEDIIEEVLDMEARGELNPGTSERLFRSRYPDWSKEDYQRALWSRAHRLRGDFPIEWSELTGRGRRHMAKKVDLERYAGKWRQESVNKEPWFQKGLRDVTAEYKLRKDGKVTVINRGKTEGGKLKVVRGVARPVSKDNRHLKVSFAPFGLFEGDYNIKSVNPSYTRAVVSSDGTRWVLVRK